jgi:hypothetical protein
VPRDAAEFGQFVARHTVRDTDPAAVVRVMTVHKAKGLGFDLVILPDLEGKTLAARRRGLEVQKAADRSVEWVLDLPSEQFFAQDGVLAAHAAAAESDACYEKICLLYVAMTRAKRAMYVITQPVGKSSSANFPRLLRDTLGEEWSAGDPRWFEKIPVAGAVEKPAAALPVLDATKVARAVRRPACSPSQLRQGELAGAELFALGDRGAGVDFGRAVHALLAEVEWLAAGDDGKNFAQAWRERGVEAAAFAAALGCLRAPELTGVWAQRAGAEVWRERAFELVLDGAWVTGVCDRVCVERDARGRAVRATVFDFKTDAVARLAGVDDRAVACELVFTRLARRAIAPT